MKIRMKDIANMANVSEATVSLVLNDKPSRISEKKKKEIKELAQQLNYMPNIAAQTLAKKTSQTIGVVIPDIENPYFSKLCKQLEERFRVLGYLTIIVNSNDAFAVEKNLIQMLVNRGVDGLIIVLSHESFAQADEQQRFLQSIETPFVLVDRQVTFPTVNQVYYDSYLGGYQAAEILLVNGHRKIAFLTGERNIPSTAERIKGYQQALVDYAVQPNDQYIIETGYRFNNGVKQAKKLFQLPEVSAVLAANDLVAFGVIKQAMTLGIHVPADFSIVGYDYLEIADSLMISLTTIEQDLSVLSEKAVELLLLTFAQSNEKREKIILKPTVHKGESIKKIK